VDINTKISNYRINKHPNTSQTLMIEQFHMLLNKNKRQMDFLRMPLQKLTGAGKTCQKATKF
jgi:hypothetical protein